ncbi:polysaccharide biosynthesis protein [Enterobacter asburiae]|uniref:polysaccharide biosynthesis protein n=1 Tax=Enterobacter asburiae TaxID=61645 RepID=UPI0014328AFB|nr:nucleoside-diphosphate sugar epimerase/dehydratase [Enterobacter asburiae]NKD22840.1 polysaccharide biosynthesis protein [Enterobacter asburiae]
MNKKSVPALMCFHLLELLGSMSRFGKRFISVIADILMISLAFWGGYWVRLDDAFPITSIKHWVLLLALSVFSVFVFARLGLYRAVLRFVSFRVLWTIALGTGASTLFLVMSSFYFSVFLPRTVTIIYFAFMVLFVGGVRLFFRALLNITRVVRTPVIIYGAGAAGRQLQMALLQGNEFYPVAFVDDDTAMHGYQLQGASVHPPSQIPALLTRHHAEKILLAMPSISRSRRQNVLQSLETYPCEILSIPGMSDLVNGVATISELRYVSIEDLLGRVPVEPFDELMNANIHGKCVMVTGAGGSIGSELCRQIIACRPSRLVLFELSEYGLYTIHAALTELDSEVEVIPLLGSVQRKRRLVTVMKRFAVDTVYHAAAYKHVPLVEYNVVEGIRNNVFGTWYCAQAALEAGVNNFVLISTDKSVRPTNTMGASKRLAELVLQALAKENHHTKFCMVRFGNVLGSSGSVVPLFREQISRGGPVTVTHEDIIRYFMTIPEAAQLVIQAGAMGEGGDVFVLDMGNPVKIMDLAKRMIRLSGLTVKDSEHPDGDIEIKVTGLRPGEKLYEELLIGGNVSDTPHPRILKAMELDMPWPLLEGKLRELDEACHLFQHEKIRELLMELPLLFIPKDEICDLVWAASTFAEQHESA